MDKIHYFYGHFPVRYVSHYQVGSYFPMFLHVPTTFPASAPRPEIGYFGLSSASSTNISTSRPSFSWYQAAVKGATSLCDKEPWQSREYMPQSPTMVGPTTMKSMKWWVYYTEQICQVMFDTFLENLNLSWNRLPHSISYEIPRRTGCCCQQKEFGWHQRGWVNVPSFTIRVWTTLTVPMRHLAVKDIFLWLGWSTL